MFERYGHRFNHTARRVAQSADPISQPLNTIVVNAALRFGQPRKEKRPSLLHDGRFQDFGDERTRTTDRPQSYPQTRAEGKGEMIGLIESVEHHLYILNQLDAVNH